MKGTDSVKRLASLDILQHSLLAYMCIETTCYGILWMVVVVVIGGTQRMLGHGLTRFFSESEAVLLLKVLSVTLLCFVLFYWERWQKLRKR